MANLGDIVLFTRTHQGTIGEYVAIVTHVWDLDVVSLHVLVPETPLVETHHGVGYNADIEVPGTWHHLVGTYQEVSTTAEVKVDVPKIRKSVS